jgi:hypothetical protein
MGQSPDHEPKRFFTVSFAILLYIQNNENIHTNFVEDIEYQDYITLKRLRMLMRIKNFIFYIKNYCIMVFTLHSLTYSSFLHVKLG